MLYTTVHAFTHIILIVKSTWAMSWHKCRRTWPNHAQVGGAEKPRLTRSSVVIEWMGDRYVICASPKISPVKFCAVSTKVVRRMRGNLPYIYEHVPKGAA